MEEIITRVASIILILICVEVIRRVLNVNEKFNDMAVVAHFIAGVGLFGLIYAGLVFHFTWFALIELYFAVGFIIWAFFNIIISANLRDDDPVDTFVFTIIFWLLALLDFSNLMNDLAKTNKVKN